MRKMTPDKDTKGNKLRKDHDEITDKELGR